MPRNCEAKPCRFLKFFNSYPEESFSGLQLMCLMYAGFKRIAPEQDTGMDLNEPWLTALGLFNSGKSS